MKKLWTIAPALALLAITACGNTDTVAKKTGDTSSSASDWAEDHGVTEGDAAFDAEPTEPETPEPTEGPMNFRVGETAKLGTDIDGVTGSVTVTKVRTSSRPVTEYGSPPENGQFVVIDVTFAALPDATEVTSVSSDAFYMLDAEGFKHTESMEMLDDFLTYTDLAAGEKVRGTIVFDVPKGTRKLAYSPNYEGEPIGLWDIKKK